jgi:hypothetical protein
MKHRLAVSALVLGLCLAVTGLSAQAFAKGGGKKQAAKREGEGDRRGASRQVRRRRGRRRDPAQEGIVLKNMWARNYQSNGFFVHASNEDGEHCVGYTMDNLLASANRSYGLFAKHCTGGKMIDSAGFHQDDSAFYVGETPCDSATWTNHGSAPAPCQAKVLAAAGAKDLYLQPREGSLERLREIVGRACCVLPRHHARRLPPRPTTPPSTSHSPLPNKDKAESGWTRRSRDGCRVLIEPI